MQKLLVILFLSLFFNCAAQQDSSLLLWYRQPAANWNEALPVGNGRLGAMVFGGVETEHLQLNEESLWAGKHIDVNNKDAAAHLKEIQQLLLADSNAKAFNLSQKYLLATPPKFRSYQPLGDLYIDFGQQRSVRNYSRKLDLTTGIHTTTYTTENGSITREVFSSAPDNCLVIRIASTQKKGLTCKVTLTRERDATITATQDRLSMNGQIIDVPDSLNGPGGPDMKFHTLVKARATGGRLQATGNVLYITDADAIVLYLTAATDYVFSKLDLDRTIRPEDTCKQIINSISKHSYEAVRSRHLAEYQKLFNRVSFRLGSDTAFRQPTNLRLERVKAGAPDNSLMTLYFQYGRYLLLSSSRWPGRLPANLQGIWNEHYTAPWNSDYHTNINLQMNYWPVHVTNLSEMAEPLYNFINNYRVPGRVTAQKMYGSSGWTLHHTTDIFGKTGLMEGVQWGSSPLSAAWLCTHLWEQYLFTNDTAFLRNKAYPVMKEAAQFIQGFLIKDQQGRLVSAPSMSPENSFKAADGSVHQLTYAPAIDVEIIRALYEACIEGGKITGESKAFIDALEKTVAALPPVQVSKRYGIVQEWIADYEEAEPGHRHISQLIGLYPFSLITPKTPVLFEAAKKTIERRLQAGGGHTGWSRAWIINFFARLLDGEKAYENMVLLLQKSTFSNLFDNHPPFQIDGNFGATAGMAEMLLQSQNGELLLLPALPKAWPDGSIKGLCARGGFVLDVAWNAGTLTTCRIYSKKGNSCMVRYGAKTAILNIKPGATIQLNTALNEVK